MNVEPVLRSGNKSRFTILEDILESEIESFGFMLGIKIFRSFAVSIYTDFSDRNNFDKVKLASLLDCEYMSNVAVILLHFNICPTVVASELAKEIFAVRQILSNKSPTISALRKASHTPAKIKNNDDRDFQILHEILDYRKDKGLFQIDAEYELSEKYGRDIESIKSIWKKGKKRWPEIIEAYMSR